MNISFVGSAKSFADGHYRRVEMKYERQCCERPHLELNCLKTER